MPLFQTITDPLSEPATLDRRPYGVIEAVDGRVVAVRLRPFPKLVSIAEVLLLGRWHHGRKTGNRCLLYYNQPRRHPSFLAVTYLVTNRGTSAGTVFAALRLLDEIARLKRSDALLCDVSNPRISDRLLLREGWQPHAPSLWHRNFIKRFAGSGTRKLTLRSARFVLTIRPLFQVPSCARVLVRKPSPGWHASLVRHRSTGRASGTRKRSWTVRQTDNNPFVRSFLMRVAARAFSPALLVLAMAGCTQNPYVLQNQVTELQQQQTTLAQRNQELQSRANTLDHDNQELESMLAQARQQTTRLQEHVTAMQEQLRGTATELAQIRDAKQISDDKAQAIVASTRRRGSASISANNSLQQTLPVMNIPGVDVRQDGDVVRIELSADRLFEMGTARLRAGAATIIDSAAGEVARAYPEQIIGIEGHTDPDVLQGQWITNHQLSTSRATTVFDHLINRAGFKADQLFVVGHGPNHPVVSNATPAGKARNRRIELVVYPDAVKR